MKLLNVTLIFGLWLAFTCAAANATSTRIAALIDASGVNAQDNK